ncbi:MAG: TetR/AcrR family transcriptional regulator, partial [Sedimenticolaceae bacterium]
RHTVRVWYDHPAEGYTSAQPANNLYVRLINNAMPKKSERTRQRIVEAANRLFYHQGYNQTSFSDVVQAANVPRGNIYYYFKTKDEILEAAVNYRTERISQMLEHWNGSYHTPI